MLEYNYPLALIKKKIKNARLQGPAPLKNDKAIVPLISTYYSNYNNNVVKQVAENLLTYSTNDRIREAFKNVTFINSLRQPPNLLRELSHSAFISNTHIHDQNGIYKCSNKRCKICRMYLQECTSFETANGKTWEVRCHINCHSLNVVYYLVCNFCKKDSYTGKTDVIRDRTNNHIRACRHGNSTNLIIISIIAQKC